MRLRSNKVIDEYSAKRAADRARRFPAVLRKDPTKTRNPARLAMAFDGTCSRAIDFRNERKLGVHDKARPGNTFRWKLKERGLS